MSAINHVMKGWWYKYPLSLVLSTNRKVTKIFKTRSSNMEYHRVYIPKDGDTWRPLGVPTLEWRIALHMWNNMLWWFIKDRYILPSQHGFIPNRGCLTAWKEILQSKILDHKYIYECDLKQFFPTVSIKDISRRLADLGMPKWEIDWVEDLNKSQPILSHECKLDESKYQIRKEQHERLLRGESLEGLPVEHTILGPIMKEYEENPGAILEAMKELGCTSLEEYAQMRWALQDSVEPTEWGTQFEGVPQGAPSSPLLAILPLRNFLLQQWSISYADDPIFYGDKPFEIKDQPEIGINLHPEKSSWVKWDGKWLKPLKYLGLEYNPWTNELVGKTRGSSVKEVKIDNQIFEMLSKFDLEYREEKRVKGEISDYEADGPLWWSQEDNTKWARVFATNLAGMLQSKLYSGRKLAEKSREVGTKMNLVQDERMARTNPDNLVLCECFSG
jgi:hypothetical protein